MHQAVCCSDVSKVCHHDCMHLPCAGQLLKLMLHHARLCKLLHLPNFSEVWAAVRQRTALPELLARQLVEHSLPAAAARLEAVAATGQPQGLHPPCGGLWLVVSTAASVLMASSQETAVRQYLGLQQTALLQLSQRLVAALPLACEEEGSEENLGAAWEQATLLLAYACIARQPAEQQGAAGRSAEPDANAQANAWAVLEALPRIAAALPLMQSVPSPSLTAWHTSHLWLLRQTVTNVRVHECSQLQQLFGGVDAGLRIAAAATVPPPLGEAAAAAAHSMTPANAVAIQAAVLAQTAALAQPLIQRTASELHATEDVAVQLRAASRTALQLHADGCRLVHRWAAAAAEVRLQLARLHTGVCTIAQIAHWLLTAPAPSDQSTATR